MNFCRGWGLARIGPIFNNTQLNAGAFWHLQRLKGLKCSFREYCIDQSDHAFYCTIPESMGHVYWGAGWFSEIGKRAYRTATAGRAAC